MFVTIGQFVSQSFPDGCYYMCAGGGWGVVALNHSHKAPSLLQRRTEAGAHSDIKGIYDHLFRKTLGLASGDSILYLRLHINIQTF